jgi:hypothetical protein
VFKVLINWIYHRAKSLKCLNLAKNAMFTKGKMVKKIGDYRLENASVWSEIRVFGRKTKKYA